jgi:hypothetical protein
MKSYRLLVALSALIPTVASAGPVYNIWANKPGYLTTLGTTQLAVSGASSASFNTDTAFAFVYAKAKTSAGDTYEFQLVSVTSTAPGDRVDGHWNVSRNGVAVCSACTGYVQGLSSGAGKPLNIFVDGGNYQVNPIITSRNDIY